MLKLDLQFFAEGDEDMDLGSMLSEFEAEWQDDEVEETPNESEELDENGEETQLEEESESENEEVQEETETQPNPNDPEAEKRNRAFADLRRQAEENKKYAEFIDRLAKESGTTPEELMTRYQERLLAQQAEKEGIPVEYLKRQQETDSKVSQLTEQLANERMEAQIEKVKAKYNADEDSIKEAFTEMFRNGVDPRVNMNIDFEKFYRAANFEKLLAAEVEKTRQADLAAKKKRQTEAAPPNGNSVAQTSGEWSDEDVDAELKRLGIRI